MSYTKISGNPLPIQGSGGIEIIFKCPRCGGEIIALIDIEALVDGAEIECLSDSCTSEFGERRGYVLSIEATWEALVLGEADRPLVSK